jgi:hypothetical protein
MGQYDKVQWRGAWLTRRQRQALIATEKAIQEKYKDFKFLVPQGSWRPQTTYSGTSHTGAGVVDLQYPGFYGNVGLNTRAEREKARFVLRKVREVGRQAALLRNKVDGMPNHYHVMDLDTHGMSSTSKYFQVPQYKLGFNALKTGVKDRYPFRPDPIRKWKYKWRDKV